MADITAPSAGFLLSTGPDMAYTGQSGGETMHQFLQRSLMEREKGGPHEQQGSKASRLRNTRSTDILHSALEEPLSPYKSLESNRPQWPTSWRRFHLNHGIRVVDHDTVVVDSKDCFKKTAKGLKRSSSGSVTYSHTHRMKVELDVTELGHILKGQVPGGGHAWTPRRLEWIFKERTGRPGCWVHYDVGIKAFLLLFPKTFEMFGNDHEFVRLRQGTAVLDVHEDAMVRLAMAREHGHTSPHGLWSPHNVEGARTQKGEPISLPELSTHRMKTTFTRSHQQLRRMRSGVEAFQDASDAGSTTSFTDRRQSK